MADKKVSEIAKEYNVTSAKIIGALKELGEDDMKATSALLPFVERKLRQKLGAPPKPEPKSEPKTLTKTTKKPTSATASDKEKPKSPKSASKPKASPDSVETPRVIPLPGVRPGAKPAASASPTDSVDGTQNAAPAGAATAMPAMSAIPTPASVARAHSANADSPRRGNNPYMLQGVPKRRQYGPQRPVGAGGRPGQGPAGRGGAGGNRQGPGGNRFDRGNAPGGRQLQRPGTFTIPGQKPGNKPGVAGLPGKPGAKGAFVRPGQKGGAFGKQGTRTKYKREKQRHAEQDILQMPTIHGISIPKGDGNTAVRLKQGASLTDFGDAIGANPANLVMILFKEFGQMITATQSLDEETLELLAVELGYKIEMVTEEDMDRELLEEFDIDLNAEEADEENLQPRPPVVTVMGHVDHGKTKLLDAIRDTNVTEREAGGITQRIGAYQIHLDHEGVDRKVTFIDTPGHEAFTAMRARGAEITDVAILVVAADDGVMPQTIEAINHAQAANVPIVVAVNKIDKPDANPDKVRGQLMEFGLVDESLGGETMFVDISAKNNIGIKDLLDAVLLTVDAAMELTANVHMPARGSVIEARLDKGRGPVVSVLIQTGTIHVGDSIVAGRAYGRVRAMSNETGRKLEEAFPSCPVRILGLQSVPTAGDSFLVAPDERTARQIAERRESAHRAALLAKRRKRMSLEDFKDAVEAGKVDRMNLIIKGDTSGSIEAIEDELIKIEEDALLKGEVGLNVIHRGVGDVTQNDVNLATVDNAVIIAFNVKTAGMAGDIADAEGVDIRFYSIIYKVIEDVELSLHGMLKPEYEESITGFAEVRAIFKSSKAGTIAGSMVKGGEIKRGSNSRVFRGEKEIATDIKIAGLKRFKEDVTSVKDGFECGITLDGWNDLREGDIIETYEQVEKPRELPKHLLDLAAASKGKTAK